MSRSISRTVAIDRLTRRDAISRLASIGAATTLAAMSFPHPWETVAASPRNRSSIVSSKKGTLMLQSTPAAESSLPTIVLVHGAFADSSSWNAIIPDLLAQGYPVVAAANPLRGVASDAESVATVLDSIAGPIVLVGHSYAGIVISNAANGRENVKALVFVAAFAPEAGENAFGLSGQFPGSTLGDAIQPVPLPDSGNDFFIRLDAFWAQFAADLPEDQAALMAVTQRPITEAALTEDASAPAWKSIPSWFVYGEEDRNIPAAAQAFMAERAAARQTVAVPGASHVVMLSQPETVLAVIENAIAAVAPMSTTQG